MTRDWGWRCTRDRASRVDRHESPKQSIRAARRADGIAGRDASLVGTIDLDATSLRLLSSGVVSGRSFHSYLQQMTTWQGEPCIDGHPILLARHAYGQDGPGCYKRQGLHHASGHLIIVLSSGFFMRGCHVLLGKGRAGWMELEENWTVTSTAEKEDLTLISFIDAEVYAGALVH